MLNLTPALKLYARYRLARLDRQNLRTTSENELLKLIDAAKDTRFGKDHHFSKIRSIRDFQKNVPLRNYEDFWEEYWKKDFPKLRDCTWKGQIPYFAVSSGTSKGATKYLPLTHEMLRSNSKAGLDLLVHHLANKPKSSIFGGANFMLGGSTELVEEAPGIFSGDLSGITVKELPFWAAPRFFPPKSLAYLKDWEEKVDKLAKASLKTDITMIGGVPSWLLIFFDKLKELSKREDARVKDFYPKLQMLVHGGVNFAPYLSQFEEILEGSDAELREVYPASEGFIALADKGSGEGLRVIVDHGIFFEFIPVEEMGSDKPKRFGIHEIDLDVNYAVIMSTCAGVWSYIIGDTVRFVNRDPARLLVTGRISYMMSAFGEHLIAEEVEDAISSASNALGLSTVDYSLGAVFPNDEETLGGHLVYAEFKDRDDLSEKETLQFRELFDKKLCQRNEDYEAHRSGGYGLRLPGLKVVPRGFFRAWMKKRGKLGGQNKVPRIINDSELFHSLGEFYDKYSP